MPRLLDYAERLLVVLLAVPFLTSFIAVLPVHPWFMVLAASEMLSVILALTRKPGLMLFTPYAFVVAILGTALPLMVRPSGGVSLAPEAVTTVLMFGGFTVSILAKLFLNRSFGMVAANRGVKSNGPYRIVRHPMYVGYIAAQAGFLLASFSLSNLVIYSIAWFFQLLRIHEEERLLMRDPAYVEFAKIVPRRLVPGIY